MNYVQLAALLKELWDKYRAWKKKGPDPQPPDPDPDPAPVPPTPPAPGVKKITMVQTVPPHGIMSMTRLSNGQVLMGEYSGDRTSRLYCLGIKDPVLHVPTGESIFRICEDNGRVYLALENYKIVSDVLRPNPRLYKFHDVKKLLPGPHDGAWDIKRVNNQLILLGGGEIVIDNKRVRTWKKRYYCKKIVHYRGVAIFPGWNTTHQTSGWLAGHPGWKWRTVGKKYDQARFISGATSPSRQSLYLVGTINYKDDAHHPDSAAFWRYLGGGKLSDPKVFKGFDYSSCIEVHESGRVFFTLTKRWKKHKEGSKLIEYTPGKFEEVAEFDESEARSIVFDHKDILVATRSHGVRGRVYRISGVL